MKIAQDSLFLYASESLSDGIYKLIALLVLIKLLSSGWESAPNLNPFTGKLKLILDKLESVRAA